MYFSDFKENLRINSSKQLIDLLNTRYNNNSNHFILSHNNSGLPELSIFVKNDMCVVYYIIDDNLYFVSVSNLDLKNDILFYDNNTGSEITLSKYNVLNSNIIEKICIDFYTKNEIPKSIEWEEL